MSERSAIPKLTGPSGGPYLRNVWYVAGWADELGEKPQAKIFLEEPVALFRDEAGIARALYGRCPHRFAPLGAGCVIDGTLACPYHGLRFDGSGTCVHNPHQGEEPPKASVPAFPLVERYRLLWIWLGDAALADPATIPDFAWLDDPRWEAVRGTTVVVTTQELPTVERFADRVAILGEHRLLLDEPMDDLRSRFRRIRGKAGADFSMFQTRQVFDRPWGREAVVSDFDEPKFEVWRQANGDGEVAAVSLEDVFIEVAEEPQS